MLIVMAGMNTSMMKGKKEFSWAKLARFELKNSCGQKAANELSRTNKHKNT